MKLVTRQNTPDGPNNSDIVILSWSCLHVISTWFARWSWFPVFSTLSSGSRKAARPTRSSEWQLDGQRRVPVVDSTADLHLTLAIWVLLPPAVKQQAVVRKHNKPRLRVAHRGIARFIGIDQKCNHVTPWSLHTFRENFMQMVQRFARNVADKEISIAASRVFSELTKNWTTSSHGHSAPSLKVSCKSVQPFSRNLANKETNKQRYKEIDRKQYPVPRCIGDGVIMLNDFINLTSRTRLLVYRVPLVFSSNAVKGTCIFVNGGFSVGTMTLISWPIVCSEKWCMPHT